MAKRKRQREAQAAAEAAIRQLKGDGVLRAGAMGGGGWTLAHQPRFSNWNPRAQDADSEAAWDLPHERAFSRDLVRTAPVATGAISTRASSIIGTGLTLQARIDADMLGLSQDQASAWQTQVERRFHMWARSQWADVSGRLNWYELQSLAIRSHDSSGDLFALIADKPRVRWPFRLAVQLIEADRVCSPLAPEGVGQGNTLVDGVELTRDGEPVAVHVSRFHPNSIKQLTAGANSWSRVPFFGASGRQQVVHLMKAARPEQTRGRPILAPIIATVKQLTRYSDAEVDAAVNSAAQAVFLTMDPNAFENIYSGMDGTEGPCSAQKDIMARAMAYDGSINSGKAINLLPGESVESPTPGRPNPNYAPFFGAMLNLIGMALNIPQEVLTKKFESSYSAARAALLDAWRTWTIERAWFAGRFCQPVYEEWLADAVALGIVQAPGFLSDPFVREAWCGSNWAGDGPGALDPTKEVDAAERRMRLGITTLAEEVVAYDGGDWEEKHAQRGREVRARVADGLEPDPAAPAASGAAAPAPAEDTPDDQEEDSQTDSPSQDSPDSTATVTA